MRILLDLSILGVNKMNHRTDSGVARYVRCLNEQLENRDDLDLRYCCVHSRMAAEAFLKLESRSAKYQVRFGQSQGVSRVDWLKHYMSHYSAMIAWAIKPANAVANHFLRLRDTATDELLIGETELREADAIHATFYPVPDRLRQYDRSLARITTVYDLIPLRLTDYQRDECHFRMTKKLVSEFNEEDWCICISEFTKQDLLNENAKLRDTQVIVTPLAAAEKFRPPNDRQQRSFDEWRRKSIGMGAEYFLSVSTIEPRKNIAVLLKAFSYLASSSDINLHLILVGACSRHTRQEIIEQVHISVQNRVHVLGYVDDEYLPGLYANAKAFVFMSMFEGFGLPPLEAMQCGSPVITSNTTSLPEVVGDGGIMLAPGDIGGLVEAMSALLSDATLSDQLRKRGLVQASSFSWASTAEKTIGVYWMASQTR